MIEDIDSEACISPLTYTSEAMPSSYVWTTREGKQIPIKDMTTQHLIAVLQFTEQKVYDELFTAAGSLTQLCSLTRSLDALDELSRRLDYVLEMLEDIREYCVNHTAHYEVMVDELKLRGMNYLNLMDIEVVT